MDLDAISLVRRQLERDRQRTTRLPGLFVHKMDRMSASPLAFLRGAAPLYYDVLEAAPELAEGPAGEGWVTGDLHLENFGAFRVAHQPSRKHRDDDEAEVTFDLNDFDDGFVGPWRLDLLRLTTSLILAGRELGADGRTTLGMCDELLAAYAAHMLRAHALPQRPPCVESLVAAVSVRSRKELLEARTRMVRGARKFARGPRYADLPGDLARAVPAAFEEFVRALDPKGDPSHYTIDDMAYRIAGTGSLGSLRVAVLTRGKGGANGQWIFDMKEQGAPSAARLVAMPRMNGAERVVTAMRACLARVPQRVGTTSLAGLPMLVRRLAPQEDKLDLRRIDSAELPALARYLGALVGRAHARGATRTPSSPWSDAERRCLVDQATRLAGLHEAAYLALCQLTR